MANSLISELRAHDERLRQVPLSLGADLRIKRALREASVEPPARKRVVLAWTFGFAGVLLLALSIWSSKREANLHPGATLTAPNPGCKVSERERDLLLKGDCSLQIGTITLSSEQDTEIRKHAEGLEFLTGHALFEVQPVRAGHPPVRLKVSGGTIEVVGTRFVVTQDAEQGSVELLEGRIRFLSHGREPIELRPHEMFAWNTRAASDARRATAAEKAATDEKTAVDPKKATTPPHESAGERGLDTLPSATPPLASASEGEARKELDAAVARVLDLRAMGRYHEALAGIDALESKPLDLRTREALSYERGTILSRLKDRAASCRHWAEHLRRFPNGQYRSFVEKQLTQGCAAGNSDAGGG
jgi:hypothetical protein